MPAPGPEGVQHGQVDWAVTGWGRGLLASFAEAQGLLMTRAGPGNRQTVA